MKIKELIKKLEEIDNKELEVILEGCDCTGHWNGELEVYGENVELKRDL